MNWKYWVLGVFLMITVLASVAGWTVAGKYYMDVKRGELEEIAPAVIVESVDLADEVFWLLEINQTLKERVRVQSRDIEALRRQVSEELDDVWGSRNLRDFKDKEELMLFLVEDKTDQMAYDATGDYEYVCSHFSFQLMRNAADKGYRMYPTLIYTLDGNRVTSLHMMNFAVVETYLVPAGEYRRTMVGIEPMTDEMILLGCLYKDKEYWRTQWVPFLP